MLYCKIGILSTGAYFRNLQTKWVLIIVGGLYSWGANNVMTRYSCRGTYIRPRVDLPATVEPPLTDILYSGHLIIHVVVRIEFALGVILYSSPKCGHLAIS